MENQVEFIENPFLPKNEALRELKKKIEDKGLSFHPYLAISAINKEVERQLTELIEKTFRGMTIDSLGKCNSEIKEYAEAEEARYQQYMKSRETAAELIKAPVSKKKSK